MPQENSIIKYFVYAHLPENLQKVSKPFSELANSLNETLLDGPEKSAGLRKLLESKDCMVRASLERKAQVANKQETQDTGGDPRTKPKD